MTMNHVIKLFSNPHPLFECAAKNFMQLAIKVIKNKGVFSVVLSGGNTPKLFFDTLTDNYYKKNIPWQKIQFFFGDERYVPADSTDSNYHMAYEYLFSKLPIYAKNIYKIPTELQNANDAAEQYEKTLRKVFQTKANNFPRFDLVYLGLGDNAHTASLMPYTDLVIRYADKLWVDKKNQLVASLWVPALNSYRITLTPSAINHSRNIIFLVTGTNKALAVWNVLKGPTNPIAYPAQLIQSKDGKTSWYLDEAAAKKLTIATI